jgi:hypothetical protein
LIMQIILRFFLVLILTVCVISATRFGWIFWAGSYNSQKADHELAEELKRHVVRLSSDIGDRNAADNYSNLKKAVGYITKEFSRYGYDVKHQKYSVYGKEVKNIIAVKSSDSPDAQTLVVGAHYDTYYNPGADDNTSAVAGVLALARMLYDEKLSLNIHFVCFVNEEPPFFHTDAMGSMIYAKMLKRNNTSVKGAVILEMIGYYSDKWFSQKYPVLLGPCIRIKFHTKELYIIPFKKAFSDLQLLFNNL